MEPGAELTVRFTQPLRPNEPVIVTSELAANRRDKIYETKGEVRAEDGRVIATATGKYMPVKETELAEMAADFIGDPSTI